MGSLSLQDRGGVDVTQFIPKNLRTSVNFNEVKEPLTALFKNLTEIFRKNPHAKAEDKEIQEAQQQAQNALLDKNKNLYGSLQKPKDPTSSKGYILSHLQALVDNAREKASIGVESEDVQTSRKIKKIHDFMQKHPDASVIELAEGTEAIKFMSSEANAIQPRLEQLVCDLATLFVHKPNHKKEEIQTIQKACQTDFGKNTRRDVASFPCFVELAKVRAKTFSNMSHQDIVHRFEAAKGIISIAKELHGDLRVFNHLLQELGYDIEKLKKLIGPQYKEVFLSIPYLSFHGSSTVSDEQFTAILKAMPHLEALYIAAPNLTYDGLHMIEKLEKLKSLTSLKYPSYTEGDKEGLFPEINISSIETVKWLVGGSGRDWEGRDEFRIFLSIKKNRKKVDRKKKGCNGSKHRLSRRTNTSFWWSLLRKYRIYISSK